MPKEIARRLMKTQWVQDRLQEDWVREIAEEWVIDSLRRGLKPEGKPRFDDFVNSLKKGEQIALSNYMDMFLGFDYKSGIKGLENLRNLEDEPKLIVGNHINNGPIRGEWQHAAISYYVKQATNQEIRLLHGFDPTTAQDLFRERLHKSINSIPVRDPDQKRVALLLKQAIKNRDSMCLYPEGDGSKGLLRGKPDAGRLMRFCARNGMTIVSCSVRYQSDTFFITFDTLDREEIERLNSKGTDRTNRYAAWQNVADFAMSSIAQSLPENRRGYYA